MSVTLTFSRGLPASVSMRPLMMQPPLGHVAEPPGSAMGLQAASTRMATSTLSLVITFSLITIEPPAGVTSGRTRNTHP